MIAERERKPILCSACDDSGFLPYSRPDERATRLYGPAKDGGPQMLKCSARCLCDAGAKLSPNIPRCDSIFTDEEIAAAFPDGPPKALSASLQAIRRAGIPPRCEAHDFASFSAHFSDEPMTLKYATWANAWCENPTKRTDLVLFGPNGTGKSGLAIAIARALVERGEHVYFVAVPELLTDWRDTFNKPEQREPGSPTEKTLIERLIAPDVLVLDEVTGSKLTDFVETTLTMIINRRQNEKKRTVITFNVTRDLASKLTPVTLAQIFGPALADRLKEEAQFWPMATESKRRYKARRKAVEYS